VFAERKRRKLAKRHLDEAIAQQWISRGVSPSWGHGAQAWREATMAAGLGAPGDPEYIQLATQIVTDAVAILSDEDRFLVTGGSVGEGSVREMSFIEDVQHTHVRQGWRD
jgi:hypothetical protein